MRRMTLSIVAAFAVIAVARLAAEEPSDGADGGVPATPHFFNRPSIWVGGGSISYKERDFETAPGLQADHRSEMVGTGLGWDFIFEGRHALELSFDAHVSFHDTERWKQDDVLIQTDTLGIQRYSFTVGYLWSTWNRAISPIYLEGPSRLYRFGVGGAGFYRRQAFERSDFIDETADPPTIDSSSVHEDFDIAGGEVVLDFEIGPRNIIAGFLRGRSGIEYVGVRNDGLRLPTGDTQIDTYGVHGQVEAGVVSQPFPNVELRLGYRWIRQDVFREKKSIYAVDPDLGPVIISIELPDNTTEMHMVFFEAAFPF